MAGEQVGYAPVFSLDEIVSRLVGGVLIAPMPVYSHTTPSPSPSRM